MLDISRLQNFDTMLGHLTAVSAPAIYAYYLGLVTAGFTKPDALTLTESTLRSLLAVPNPTEQPTPVG
jgi:hypothetical protein